MRHDLVCDDESEEQKMEIDIEEETLTEPKNHERELDTEVVDIKIPDDTEDEIRRSTNTSETLRLQIQNSLDEQNEKSGVEDDTSQTRVKQTRSTDANDDIKKKVESLYEILEDRATSDTVTTLDEICEITSIPKADISAFMLRLNRVARDHSRKVKKLKRKTGTCYLLS